MSQVFEKGTGNQGEKDGRGRRVPEKVRNLIKNTFLDLIAEGKTGRETSAALITQRIEEEHPEIIPLVPSLQSVNKIVEPYRKRAGSISPLDQDWSLSLWMREPHGISRADLPLILKVQKAMALDTEHRLSIGFKEYRLSVREAKWLGTVYEILINPGNDTEDDQDSAIDDDHPLFISTLVSQVKDYSRREQALELLEEPVDSYDLDLELACKDALHPFSNKGFTKQSLYKELRLIPDSSIMPLGQEILGTEYSIGLLEPMPSEESYRGERLSPETDLIIKTLMAMLEEGIEVKVRFGTEDWSPLHSRTSWGSIPWTPNLEDLFSTSGDYVIDLDLLITIRPLIKFEEPIVESDLHQVKVATAFWMKIKERVIQMIKDPEVQSKLQSYS